MQLRNIFDALWRRADSFAHPLEQRQNNPKVLTIVQVVTSIEPQTFIGSVSMPTSTEENTKASQAAGSVMVGGAVRPTSSPSTSEESIAPSTAVSSDDSAPSITAAASSAAASSAAASSAAQSSRPSSTASSQVSQVTSAPIVNAVPSNTQAPAATPAASQRPSASASPTAAASSGMSGGAKAGLAFGIIFLIVALLAGVLMLYRRQKQQQEAHERLDDEKAAMSTSSSPYSPPRNPEPVHLAAPVMAPVARSQDSPSPRLDIRPVTQFDPRLSTMNTGAPAVGAVLGGAAAAGAVGGAALAADASSRVTSPNSWEKRGATQHANDPTNPFGNHAETLNSTPLQSNVQISSGHSSIDASDFPLPISGQASPQALSTEYEGFTESLSNPVIPYAPDTVSHVSLPVSEIAAAGVAGVVVAGAGAAVVAGKGGDSPPLDNVHRVQLDFKPSMEDELEIHSGHFVRLLHEYDDGWALCTRMDRSQQGVVPRTCLSKQMVKPRPNPNNSGRSGAPPSQLPRPSQGPRGPGPNGNPQMRGPGPHMMAGNGRNSPAPFAQAPRPLTPTGRGAPFAQAPRPMSPAGSRQGQRSRAMSNAPYRAYQPGPGPQGPNGQQQRSQSPGPYGPPGMMRPPPIKDNNRRRSNSMSNIAPGSAHTGNAPMVRKTPSLARKPVPGQAV
ncbi:hypothetical protein E6O75_ATG11094 [Venturia nashicola]|uniref:SH3 domain-containing protein n=1 Tax=Venturia nashicola TaxID=86259 RepID=A0A4Z1PGX9_9PEZI|nr:hypothetical protein E6O75_ATG11094 [Venturia nashicola]